MRKIEYEKMFVQEDDHFWFVGKRYFIQTYLSKIKTRLRNILDIGSGTGGTTKMLAKYGNVTGVEKSEVAVSYARSRGLKIIQGEVEKLPLKNKSFELVTIFDVLYHKDVKNVESALSEISRVIKPGGYLLITDSAFAYLKGKHSEILFESRRFTVGELKILLANHFFKVVASSYIYATLFPAIFLKRKFIDILLNNRESDVFKVPSMMNKLLLALLRTEAKLLEFISFPFGSSVIILAQKNEEK